MSRTGYVVGVILFLAVVGSVLWGVRHFVGGDAAAVIGAVVLSLAVLLGHVGYVIFVLEAPDDVGQMRDAMRPYTGGLFWPMAIAPGLWIGMIARNPLGVAIAYLLIWQVLGWFISFLPPRYPNESRLREVNMPALLYRTCVLLAFVLVGTFLRAVLAQ